jgi:hypothetical protein
LVPVDVTGTNQDISTRARKAEILFRKRRNRRMPTPNKSSVINAGVSNLNRTNAIEKLLSPNYIYRPNSGILP